MLLAQLLESNDMSRWDEIQNNAPSSIAFTTVTTSAVARDVKRAIDRLNNGPYKLSPQEVDRYVIDMFDQLRMEVLDQLS